MPERRFPPPCVYLWAKANIKAAPKMMPAFGGKADMRQTLPNVRIGAAVGVMAPKNRQAKARQASMLLY